MRKVFARCVFVNGSLKLTIQFNRTEKLRPHADVRSPEIGFMSRAGPGREFEQPESPNILTYPQCMKKTQLLLDIPHGVLCDILGEWLDLKWLARIDSALCNHQFRDTFLGIIKSASFSFLHFVDLHENGLLMWLSSRQFRLRSILIGAKSSFQMTTYIREHGSSVWRVKCYSVNAIDQAALYCRNLMCLECRGMLRAANLSAVLWFNRELQELRFKYIDDLTATHFDKIALANVSLLALINTNCDDELLERILCSTGNVRRLTLGGSKSISDSGVTAVAHHLPQLRAFGAHDLTITDNTLANLALLCPRLMHLHISRNSSVTDAGVCAIVISLKGLQSLCISNCPLLTSQSLEHIAANSANTLTVLRMAGFVSVHVDSLAKLLQACTSLHTLSLDCDLNQYHQEIVPHMRSLRTFVTYHLLTDKVLACIAQHCRDLEKLAIFCCKRFISGPVEQSEQNDTNHPHVMYGANHIASQHDLMYSQQGVLALLDGLPFLRLLGIHKDDKQMTGLAEELCVRLYPRLSITRSVRSFGYDVLEQSIV